MEPLAVQDLTNNQLRFKLTMLARGIRRCTIPDDADLTKPQSERDDTIYFQGRLVKRKRIVLLTPGCTVATCTMCPLPNEALDPARRSITPEQIIEQFDSSFSKEDDDYEIITIYHNGNFFVEKEIPTKVRQHIYNFVRNSPATTLVVESLPQFVTEERMAEAKQFLGKKKLSVSIGLQSSDDIVRELAVNSTCSRIGFEKANNLLLDNGYSTVAFLMIKPPFLTEHEAIEDTLNSIKYLQQLGISESILCATRITPNTIVHILHEEGNFTSPWLWSVLEVLKRAANDMKESLPRVAISELSPQQNIDSINTQNCEKCSNKIVEAITLYNTTRDLTLFDSLECSCEKDYLDQSAKETETFKNTPIRDRIIDFVKHYEQSH